MSAVIESRNSCKSTTYAHRSRANVTQMDWSGLLSVTFWAGELQVIGDCLAPRTAEEAVYEGLKIGREL